MNNNLNPRTGCRDIWPWNSFMVEGADFTLESDMPIVRCISPVIPKRLISFTEAKTIYRRKKSGESDFKEDAYVHFYIDDYKFDSKRNNIWMYPDKAYEILQHFSGIITPDFSTNADFPDAIKRFNTYRMRAYGYWFNSLKGIPAINNVRWGDPETWSYCFDGIPLYSTVAIGTVASGLRKLENRPMFNDGFLEMLKLIKPKVIIVYGSANYPIFEAAKEKGITVTAFDSDTNTAFKERRCSE